MKTNTFCKTDLFWRHTLGRIKSRRHKRTFLLQYRIYNSRYHVAANDRQDYLWKVCSANDFLQRSFCLMTKKQFL